MGSPRMILGPLFSILGVPTFWFPVVAACPVVRIVYCCYSNKQFELQGGHVEFHVPLKEAVGFRVIRAT